MSTTGRLGSAGGGASHPGLAAHLISQRRWAFRCTALSVSLDLRACRRRSTPSSSSATSTSSRLASRCLYCSSPLYHPLGVRLLLSTDLSFLRFHIPPWVRPRPQRRPHRRPLGLPLATNLAASLSGAARSLLPRYWLRITTPILTMTDRHADHHRGHAHVPLVRPPFIDYHRCSARPPLLPMTQSM